MSDKREMIPIGGLLATIAAADLHGGSARRAQGRRNQGNFTNAAKAEVRDAQGQVVLQGHVHPA